MGITADASDDGLLVLPACLDLAAAGPLHALLLDASRIGEPIIVAAMAVERIATAAVQVLLAAAADARARGVAFRLNSPSPVLLAALADLGVAAHLGC